MKHFCTTQFAFFVTVHVTARYCGECGRACQENGTMGIVSIIIIIIIIIIIYPETRQTSFPTDIIPY